MVSLLRHIPDISYISKPKDHAPFAHLDDENYESVIEWCLIYILDLNGQMGRGS